MTWLNDMLTHVKWILESAFSRGLCTDWGWPQCFDRVLDKLFYHKKIADRIKCIITMEWTEKLVLVLLKRKIIT